MVYFFTKLKLKMEADASSASELENEYKLEDLADLEAIIARSKPLLSFSSSMGVAEQFIPPPPGSLDEATLLGKVSNLLEHGSAGSSLSTSSLEDAAYFASRRLKPQTSAFLQNSARLVEGRGRIINARKKKRSSIRSLSSPGGCCKAKQA